MNFNFTSFFGNKEIVRQQVKFSLFIYVIFFIVCVLFFTIPYKQFSPEIKDNTEKIEILENKIQEISLYCMIFTSFAFFISLSVLIGNSPEKEKNKKNMQNKQIIVNKCKHCPNNISEQIQDIGFCDILGKKFEKEDLNDDFPGWCPIYWN